MNSNTWSGKSLTRRWVHLQGVYNISRSFLQIHKYLCKTHCQSILHQARSFSPSSFFLTTSKESLFFLELDFVHWCHWNIHMEVCRAQLGWLPVFKQENKGVGGRSNRGAPEKLKGSSETKTAVGKVEKKKDRKWQHLESKGDMQLGLVWGFFCCFFSSCCWFSASAVFLTWQMVNSRKPGSRDVEPALTLPCAAPWPTHSPAFSSTPMRKAGKDGTTCRRLRDEQLKDFTQKLLRKRLIVFANLASINTWLYLAIQQFKAKKTFNSTNWF